MTNFLLEDIKEDKTIQCLINAILIIVCCFLTYSVIVVAPEIIQQDKTEKIKLSSMSCDHIGKWLIDNSQNQDDNYPYAQAKYLVCTHTGAMP